MPRQGILSPSCLLFHHIGIFVCLTILPHPVKLSRDALTDDKPLMGLLVMATDAIGVGEPYRVVVVACEEVAGIDEWLELDDLSGHF